MVIGVHHESAKIYAFPSKRFSSAATRQKADIAEDMDPCVYDSCWYHDDAMKEEAATSPKSSPRLVD
jgi:hypothetical protein